MLNKFYLQRIEKFTFIITKSAEMIRQRAGSAVGVDSGSGSDSD